MAGSRFASTAGARRFFVGSSCCGLLRSLVSFLRELILWPNMSIDATCARDQQCQWQTEDLLQSLAAEPDLVVWGLPSMPMFLSHVLVSDLVTGGKLHSCPPGKDELLFTQHIVTGSAGCGPVRP